MCWSETKHIKKCLTSLLFFQSTLHRIWENTSTSCLLWKSWMWPFWRPWIKLKRWVMMAFTSACLLLCYILYNFHTVTQPQDTIIFIWSFQNICKHSSCLQASFCLYNCQLEILPEVVGMTLLCCRYKSKENCPAWLTLSAISTLPLFKENTFSSLNSQNLTIRAVLLKMSPLTR